MNEKDLYQQKLEAQLNEWQADIDKMKAKMAGASVGAKLELSQHLNMLEGKVEEGKEKMSELSETTDENWEAMKTDIDSFWESITAEFKEAYKKYLG